MEIPQSSVLQIMFHYGKRVNLEHTLSVNLEHTFSVNLQHTLNVNLKHIFTAQSASLNFSNDVALENRKVTSLQQRARSQLAR